MKIRILIIFIQFILSLGGGIAGAFLYLEYFHVESEIAESAVPVSRTSDFTQQTGQAPVKQKRIYDQEEANKKAAVLNKAMAEKDVPALFSLLKDPMISGPAAMTLVMVAPDDVNVIGSLIRIAEDGKEDIRIRIEILNAVSTLEKNDKVAQFLIDSVKSDSPQVRLAAAKSIAYRSPKSSIPHLIRLLDDGDQSVAGEIPGLLSAATGKDLGNDKAKWLEWWEREKNK
ncbi:MAG: HEAT repeat domain-containing protein [Deltaproteobacteria bacterium]|nr:HEAT repeat domain-containing protein [Deltaproteobacteria bacterium]